MATGVASRFVDLLGAEVRQASRQLIVAGILAAVLFVPAYFLAPPAGLGVHLAGLLIGLFIGFLAAKRLTQDCETSLRRSWSDWMKMSVAAETVWHVHRRVVGKGLRNLPYLWAAGLLAIWALELALLTVAFQDETSLTLAFSVLIFNGLVAGVLLGRALKLRTWVGTLRDSIGDLVASGELGVWGVM